MFVTRVQKRNNKYPVLGTYDVVLGLCSLLSHLDPSVSSKSDHLMRLHSKYHAVFTSEKQSKRNYSVFAMIMCNAFGGNGDTSAPESPATFLGAARSCIQGLHPSEKNHYPRNRSDFQVHSVATAS